MKRLDRSQIPDMLTYYRSGSKVFYEYYRSISRGIIGLIRDDRYEFFRAEKTWGTDFYSVQWEKIDTEPTREFLSKFGIRKGIVFWSPMRITTRPPGWIRLPTFFARGWLHSSRSAFSILDQPEYWKKWSPSARGHRRKVLAHIASGRIEIRQIHDGEEYLRLYRAAKIPDPNKEYLLQWCKRKFARGLDNLRLYIALVDGVPLAGAVFIDEGVTSEYFASFYSRESYPYHLGIAIMDRWFHDSYETGIQYCDLDHMRDTGQSWGYAGYTTFKSSIADHDVYFHDVWVRVFL